MAFFFFLFKVIGVRPAGSFQIHLSLVGRGPGQDGKRATVPAPQSLPIYQLELIEVLTGPTRWEEGSSPGARARAVAKGSQDSGVYLVRGGD